MAGGFLAASGMAAGPSFDAVTTYLPLARRILSEGISFLSHPDSITTAPLSYLWPALLGARLEVARWANVGLFLAAIALAFFAVRAAHSSRAGVVAALLLATAPALTPYMADALTEPPFVFLIAVWATAIAVVLRGYRRTGLAIGGIALGLAALTRPSVAYFPLLGVAYFAWRSRRAPVGERGVDAALAGLHGIALALALAWMARNAVVFGYPSIATGSGAALFLGVNALVDGFDPVYYGLDYDTGAVTRELSHLSIEGDRLLRGTALAELARTPWTLVAEMWGRKALAFLFMPSLDAVGGNTLLVRSWRIAAVVFAAVAVAAHHRSRFVAALAGLVVYSVAMHLPVMMHHRYSAGLLELPLALLAAIGFAHATSRAWLLTGLAATAVTGIFAGGWLLREPGPYQPHPERSPHQEVWTWQPAAGGLLRLDGASRSGAASLDLAPPGGAIEIDVRDAPLFHPWDVYWVTLNLAAHPVGGKGCTSMTLRYKGVGDAGFAPARQVRVPLSPSRAMKAITAGAAIPLALKHEGVLRVEFECPSAARIDLGAASIAAPRRAGYYRAVYLDKSKEGGGSR